MKAFFKISYLLSFLFFSISCSHRIHQSSENTATNTPQKSHPNNEDSLQSNDDSNFKNNEKLKSFEGGLMEAVDVAKQEGKLVFMDVSAVWCMPCRVMQEEVFTQESVISKIEQSYIYYHVDGEKDNGPGIVQLYDIKAYPSLFIIDNTGEIVDRHTGSMSTATLLKFLK